MDVELFALWYITLVVSLVVHEAAHATVALLGGDPTAYIGGQVTLNPIPHMRREPFGTIVLPIVMLILSHGTMCFGYAHTPIDARWASRFPKRAALMSAAGPISNILIALIAFFVLKSMVWTEVAAPHHPAGQPLMFVAPYDATSWIVPIVKMASLFLFLNILLAILNLFPWPPFDGAGVVGGLSRNARRLYDAMAAQPFMGIVGLVAAWQLLTHTGYPVLRWAIYAL